MENLVLESLREQLAGSPNARLDAVPLYPGISLIYLSLAQCGLSLKHSALDGVLQIHYCRTGQTLWEMGSGSRIYLNPGDFSVHTLLDCPESALTFPTGQYEGLALCVDLRAGLPEPLEGADVFPRLQSRFGQAGRPVFLAGDPETTGIFSSFYGKPGCLRLAYQRLKALELLLYLSGLEPDRVGRLSEYRQEHIDIVREIHGQLLCHMERRVTIEELARQYLINPTTLKAVFKSVYGSSLAAHVKEHRMEQAAKLLRETDQSIAEIARSVGYDSQSRFTAAFKEVFHTLPTLYRKQSQNP